MKRQEVYDNFFGAKSLFITGLLIMPSVLFNPSTEARIVQFLFFWFLVFLCGKKQRFFFTLFIITGITAANLIIPHGRVLFTFGVFKITSGALKAGIHRAVTFEALVMISKVSISRDLKFPGVFGEILGESFRLFSVMMNRKINFKNKNIFLEIDNLLLELSSIDPPAAAFHDQKTKPAGFIIMAAVILLSWFLFSAGLFLSLT